jgi:hypothetical protein
MKALILVTALLVATGWADEEDVLGVIVGKSGFECGKNCAIGADGVAVYGDGHGNYITSKGFAYKSGTDYVASDCTYVTQSNGWFYGSKYAIPAGMAYMNSSSTFVGRPVVLRKP